MISIDSVIKAFTISVRVAIAIALAAATLLFTRAPQLLAISLTGETRTVIAVLLIASLAVLAAAAIVKAWESIAARLGWKKEHRKQKRQWWREHQERVALLTGMTFEERAVCRGFILGDRRTVFLPPVGTVSALVARGVLRQLDGLTTNQLGEIGASFMMEDWAWNHLRENKELVIMPRLDP
jgi:hypothetical protein